MFCALKYANMTLQDLPNQQAYLGHGTRQETRVLLLSLRRPY
jgi:hypothetical protein